MADIRASPMAAGREKGQQVTEGLQRGGSQVFAQAFRKDCQDGRRLGIPGPGQFRIRGSDGLGCFFHQVGRCFPGFRQGIRITFQELAEFLHQTLMIIIRRAGKDFALTVQETEDPLFRGKRNGFQQGTGAFPGKGNIPVQEQDIIRYRAG